MMPASLIMAQQNYNHEDKRDYANRGTERNTGVALPGSGSAIARRIPNFSEADQEKNQRPVRFQNLVGFEAGMPVSKQKQHPKRDQQNGHNQRRPGLPVVLRHCAPPRLLIRVKNENSSP